MPNSAGGGEAPDWPTEDVMSRPAREALPQLPPHPPCPRPHRWCRRPGCWAAGGALGDPGFGLCTPGSPRPPPHPGEGTHRVGWKEPARLSLWRAKGRPVRPDRAPPRPAPPRPGAPFFPPALPAPPLPLSAAAVGPGGRRGRRRAGTARSPAALWAARLSGRTSRLAPRSPRRSRSRLLLSPPPRLPPPLDHERRALGPWLCPSRTLG